ncbi:SRPBCC family protein [Rhodococcus koreensis]
MVTTLPALSDIPGGVLPGVLRIETSDKEATTPIILDMLRSVYPHEQVFGEYCTVNGYIAAPPRDVYAYLAHTRSLEEWTYSLRGFTPTEQPGLWIAHDRLGSDTTIYTRTVTNAEAMTVDYHCAWDQGWHLWMIYLLRVVDAQTVFDKPGSVVLWTNCHHPFYDCNPYPDTAPPDRRPWVGDFWDMFAAGHQLELTNLTALCEYRARRGLPITPAWMG